MAKKKDKIDEFIEERIVQERLEDLVGERFGKYSKYIIQERAIPDVRDGLKPVQRRILYGMYTLRNFSNQPFKKSAKIAGEIMGNYHPHGDSSIYDAMVRLSQPWKMGATLIEMHGNNGSIDGDSAAAMRYTESRLTKHSEYLLKDLDKKTVNFAPNYNDEEVEPTVLPSKYPNILVNGSTGISAGYATNIPPHNLNEVIDATIALIDKPNLKIDDLLKYMQGPDFPTGGIVQGLDGIKQAFETGKGRVIVRSKVEIEETDTVNKFIITEIPYEVNKATLVNKIEQLRIDKILDDIVECRDESDRDGLKIVIDYKKTANSQAILNYLFKSTDLQISYNYNMVAICNHRPLTLGVIGVLSAYVDHQKEIITNRSNYELEKANHRLHIIEGLIRLVDVLDEVIAIIRKSKGKADSKINIIAAFAFTEIQAEAIVTLQLYKLSSTDVFALIAEGDELKQLVARLNAILSSEKELLKVIKSELREVQKELSQERRSVIEEEVMKIEINEQELISKEEVKVNISRDGYIKRSNLKSANAGGVCGLKEGDATIFQKEVETLDTLLVFTNLGNYFYIPVYKIEETKWKDLGVHINNLALLGKSEKIIDVLHFENLDKPGNILLCSKYGLVKQTALKDFEVQRYNKTFRAMKLSSEDELISVSYETNITDVIVVTKQAEVLRFKADEISLYGTQASGIKSINLKPTDSVVKGMYVNTSDDLILLTKRGNLKRMRVDEFVLSKRARAGSSAIKFIKSNPNYLASAATISLKQINEAVLINVCYEKGNDYIKANELKYNVSDAGKSFLNEELGEVYMLFIDKELSKITNVKPRTTTPSNNSSSTNEGSSTTASKTTTSTKTEAVKKPEVKQEVKTDSIISELDDILARELEALNKK